MCSPHSLQHLLDLTFGLRELLCIAGAQHYIRVGPVLWIEERIAPDRDPGIGLGDLTELHTNVALARIRAQVSESMRTPILSLGATSSSIACMNYVLLLSAGAAWSGAFGLFVLLYAHPPALPRVKDGTGRPI